jgi:hypothetical protein
MNQDEVCEHGTAMDVHCCGCHSGFLFSLEECTCLATDDPDGEALEAA